MALKRNTKYERRTTNDGFGKVGVLMGGPSEEREISLKSGRAVCAALEQAGVEALAMDIRSDDREENIRALGSAKINCAFVALHGRFGEDGAIQEILEGLNIPYTGSGVSASRLAMDKAASLKLFTQCGLRVPDYEVVRKACCAADKLKCRRLGLPLVAKPSCQGSSIGLSIVRGRQDLDQALEAAFAFGEDIVVGEYVKGREFTVGILDDAALPVVEIIPKNIFFDYQAKYTQGMTDYQVPAKLDQASCARIKEAGLAAHRALGCFAYSRVDMILGQDGSAYVLELNTIPGMTSTSLLPKAANAAGIRFSRLCLKLLELAYEKK